MTTPSNSIMSSFAKASYLQLISEGGQRPSRPQPRAQRSGSRLERRSSGMSELSQYGAPKSWSIAFGERRSKET